MCFTLNSQGTVMPHYECHTTIACDDIINNNTIRSIIFRYIIEINVYTTRILYHTSICIQTITICLYFYPPFTYSCVNNT